MVLRTKCFVVFFLLSFSIRLISYVVLFHDMENLFNCFTRSAQNGLLFWRCDGCVLCVRDEKCAFDSIVSHWLTSTELIKIRFIKMIIIIKIILSNFRCPTFPKAKIPFEIQIHFLEPLDWFSSVYLDDLHFFAILQIGNMHIRIRRR